jgi:hypothetical protein
MTLRWHVINSAKSTESKPVYPVQTFISQLSDGIDSIISKHSDFILIVAGDFNSLCTDFITSDFGLYQLVKSPTSWR